MALITLSNYHNIGVNLAFPVCMSEALMLIQFKYANRLQLSTLTTTGAHGSGSASRGVGSEIPVAAISTSRIEDYKFIKNLHILFHSFALIFGSLGVYAIFKNHYDRGTPINISLLIRIALIRQ